MADKEEVEAQNEGAVTGDEGGMETQDEEVTGDEREVETQDEEVTGDEGGVETQEVTGDEGETVSQNREGTAGDGGRGSRGNGPPPYRMPSGLGEGIKGLEIESTQGCFVTSICNLFSGVPIKPGGHRESAMSSLPLTDTAVMKEMKEADQRCTAIAAEIEQLKKELTELTNVI